MDCNRDEINKKIYKRIFFLSLRSQLLGTKALSVFESFVFQVLAGELVTGVNKAQVR